MWQRCQAIQYGNGVTLKNGVDKGERLQREASWGHKVQVGWHRIAAGQTIWHTVLPLCPKLYSSQMVRQLMTTYSGDRPRSSTHQDRLKCSWITISEDKDDPGMLWMNPEFKPSCVANCSKQQRQLGKTSNQRLKASSQSVSTGKMPR